jgi:hypothetical protein
MFCLLGKRLASDAAAGEGVVGTFLLSEMFLSRRKRSFCQQTSVKRADVPMI